MAKYYNPFKPNYPIYDELFTGRLTEIKIINSAFKQLAEKNPVNLLFTGERGIGKSSLLLVSKHLATGNVNLPGEKNHNFITINLSLNTNTTLIDFIVRFKKALDRELFKIDRTKKVLGTIWGFVERLQVAGVKLNKDEKGSLEEITDDFTYSLIETIEKIKADSTDKDGIVLIIDEADTGSKDLGLGSFLKNLTEGLTAESCHSFMIIMCGLPQTSEILRKSHESSHRLFEEHELGPLLPNESLIILPS
jgi:DNA polymerase III delta prime subunit